MLWLLLYTFALSLYDLRTRRIPNWATLPMLLAGVIAHFPGSTSLWLATLSLVLAWANDWMGGGDTKLWLAVLWALPIEVSASELFLLFATFLLTALLQITWRAVRRQAPTGLPGPAAWRTIPFILAYWYVH